VLSRTPAAAIASVAAAAIAGVPALSISSVAAAAIASVATVIAGTPASAIRYATAASLADVASIHGGVVHSLKWTMRCPMGVLLPGRDLAWFPLGNDNCCSIGTLMGAGPTLPPQLPDW